MYGSLVELQVGKYLQLILKNQNFYRYKYRYSLAPKFFNYWTSFHFFVLGISLKNTHFVILHLSPSLNPCILHSFAHTPPPCDFAYLIFTLILIFAFLLLLMFYAFHYICMHAFLTFHLLGFLTFLVHSQHIISHAVIFHRLDWLQVQYMGQSFYLCLF